LASLLALLQGTGGWTAAPTAPTVGDTIWLSRLVAVDPAWRVRAGRLDATQDVEPLGDAVVVRAAGGWLVRYPVVMWTPRRHDLPAPAPITREADVADAHWLAAGEPKAVAARAAARLRAAVAGAVPEAHPALSTDECLATVAERAPKAPLRDLREVLTALD